MTMDVYPYLADLLGGYFHQDAFDDGETVEDIVADFKASSWEHQQLGLRADIRRLLHEHSDDLLQSVERFLSPSVILGANDADVRDWLMRVDAALG